VTVSIHQPHFLPWMGYLNKVLSSDVFVWLHSVQYRKNYYQNRTRIKDAADQPMWLTIPVHAHLHNRIDEVTAAGSGWREKLSRTVEQCYRKAPFFEQCWPSISRALADSTDNLNDINYGTFTACMCLLGVTSVRVKTVGEIATTSDDPTLRLVEICSSLGATRYIAGKGGHNYLNVQEFEKAGIEVIWQEFNPERVVYQQVGRAFVPGLSIIDGLFNAGPERTLELSRNAWTPPRP